MCLTALDVFLILWLQRRGFRHLEAASVALIGIVVRASRSSSCSPTRRRRGRPRASSPTRRSLRDPGRLYLAIGILGATVMPHNLYLHSSIVQTRRFPLDPAGRRDPRASRSPISSRLLVAVSVNASILVLAAPAFHAQRPHEVADLTDAHHLLSPLLGASAARLVFAIALLCIGPELDGHRDADRPDRDGRLSHAAPAPVGAPVDHARLAIVPALIVVALAGEGALGKLLILSQAVLSVQLPFAVIPLIRLTSDRAKMGELASPRWLTACAWLAAAIILALNGLLLGQLVTGRGA